MANTETSLIETLGIPEIEQDMEVFGMTQTPVDKTLSISEMAADAKSTGDAIKNVKSEFEQSVSELAIDMVTKDMIETTFETEGNAADSKAVGDKIEELEKAIAAITSTTYPVGTIYIKVGNGKPDFAGTWVEIQMPATWSDLKNGTRSYAEVETSATDENAVHFWLRKE